MSLHTNAHPAVAPKTWMHDLTFLADRALKDIVIPGAHDSGTYAIYNKVDNNSSQCQEISVLEQLRAGARYLDLRAWKASDGAYWMYHGLAWTSVKLEDVLKDIDAFLKESDQEVVIATLLIDEKSNVDEGWAWACDQVKTIMATSADVGGRNFAEVTPRQLRDAGKRFVMLRSGDVKQLGVMNRDGAYGDSLEPKNYLVALDNMRIWTDRMWILHLGIPYKGEIHNTMVDRASWNAAEFVPRFKGETPHNNWLQRRLNIINVDFIQRFGWVDAIVKLNYHFPKSWPQALSPQVASHDYSWTLKTTSKQGRLHVHAETNAPFRAQQGCIYVYDAGATVPVDPDSHAAAWTWDDQCQDWDTGLSWKPGMQELWLAEKSANGPDVFFHHLKTTRHQVDTATATFTWVLRAGKDANNRLVIDGDTNAPFRAQQGQIHVYPSSLHSFPAEPGGAQSWAWDNDVHTWQTELPWQPGQRVAWVAHKPSNGPYAYCVKHVLA